MNKRGKKILKPIQDSVFQIAVDKLSSRGLCSSQFRDNKKSGLRLHDTRFQLAVFSCCLSIWWIRLYPRLSDSFRWPFAVFFTGQQGIPWSGRKPWRSGSPWRAWAERCTGRPRSDRIAGKAYGLTLHWYKACVKLFLVSVSRALQEKMVPTEIVDCQEIL